MTLREEILNLPFYDTHCHIGCVDAAGRFDGAYMCDCVRGHDLPPLNLFAVLEGSYMTWMLSTIGENLDAVAREAGHASSLEWAGKSPEKWWAANWRRFQRLESTGVLKAVVRGIKELHGFELRFEERTPIIQLNEQIVQAYKTKGFYGLWKEAFRKLSCVRGVKLVEMPYYDSPVADDACWRAEQELVVSALRVDSFTTLHLPSERLSCRLSPERIGIKAGSLDDYLSQMYKALERALAGGMRALKNAYAYFGPLKLPPPDKAAADRYVREGKPENYRAFESVVLHHLLGWCDERKLPYQMHAGVVVIPWCNPAQLADQMGAYPNVKFVPMHIYPYHQEAGCMARMRPNTYLDPCWLSIVAPEALRCALREWIGFVPPEKMVFGIDSTTVECWYGGALTAKEIMADVLEEKIARGELGKDEALRIARQILHDTADVWYG